MGGSCLGERFLSDYTFAAGGVVSFPGAQAAFPRCHWCHPVRDEEGGTWDLTGQQSEAKAFDFHLP